MEVILNFAIFIKCDTANKQKKQNIDGYATIVKIGFIRMTSGGS